MAPAAALKSGPEGGKLPEFQTLRDYIEHLRNLERAFYLRSSRSLLDEDLAPVDLNVKIPALEHIKRRTIFIAFDLEDPQSAISEVGFARLCLKDIRDLAPGKQGHRWLKQTRSMHYRVEELKGYKGRRGNPESYPRSRFISQADLKQNIELVFDFYTAGGKKNLVLVGHGVHNDIEKLKKILGLDIETTPGFKATFDTEKLYSAFVREQQHLGHIATKGRNYWRWPKSLETVANAFRWPTSNLHNAAWDAAYTLRAMLAILTATVSSRKRGSDMQQFFDWSDRTAVTYHADYQQLNIGMRAVWLENLILRTLDKTKSVLVIDSSEDRVARASQYLHRQGICHSRLDDKLSESVRVKTHNNFKSGINRIVVATTAYIAQSDLVADQIVVLGQELAITRENFWKEPESLIRSRKINRAFRSHDLDGCDIHFFIACEGGSSRCERLYSKAPVSTQDRRWMQEYKEWKEEKRLAEQEDRW